MSSGALSWDCASLFKQWPCRFSPFMWIMNISIGLKVWDRHALGTWQQWHTQIVGVSKGGGDWRAQILVAWHDSIQKYEKCTRNLRLYHLAHTYSHHKMRSRHGKPLHFGHTIKIHPGTNCRKGDGEWDQQLSEVSAALISKLVTHNWGNLITAQKQSTTRTTKEKF